VLFVGQSEEEYNKIKTLLEELDFNDLEVSWEEGFETGTDYAEQNAPDLILVDYHLGEHTGLEFLAEVRKRNCIKPVLLLSQKFEYKPAMESLEAGAEGYLEKNLGDPQQMKIGILKAIERFRALEAIRKSESRMRGIFLWSSIGIVLFDKDRLIVQPNPAFGKMIGYTVEELCAMDIAEDFTAPEDLEAVQKKFARVAEDHQPFSRLKARFQRRDGDSIWVDLTFSPFSEADEQSEFVIGLVEDITEERENQHALKISMEKLNQLSADLLSAQENERRDVALELHDVIGGNLGAMKYLVEQMKSSTSPRSDLLEQMDMLTVETLDEIERLSSSLRPPMLDDLGVVATLRWLVKRYNGIYSDIVITLSISVDEEQIPHSVKIVLFRIAQEAINNAVKHSHGERVEVTLAFRDGDIMLEVSDNGDGFKMDEENNPGQASGLGLRNMNKRAELSNGKIEMATEPGKGTTIRAEWPVE
jgi:PAS domain S-box-containing protein